MNGPSAEANGGPSSDVPISTVVPAVVVPVVVVAVGIFLLIFFIKKKKSAQTVTTSIDMQNLTGEDRLHVPYKELKFNKEIGSGSFGKVFIGGKSDLALF